MATIAENTPAMAAVRTASRYSAEAFGRWSLSASGFTGFIFTTLRSPLSTAKPQAALITTHCPLTAQSRNNFSRRILAMCSLYWPEVIRGGIHFS